MVTYEPGTVAVATVRGIEGVRVIRYHAGTGRLGWMTADRGIGSPEDEVTDIRPLVVLDLAALPTYLGGWPNAVAVLRDQDTETGRAIADQIEAQTKPPRIPEPGLWGVVKAAREELYGSSSTASGEWVRVDYLVCPWTHTSGTFTAEWSDLIDPVLIRDGVES